MATILFNGFAHELLEMNVQALTKMAAGELLEPYGPNAGKPATAPVAPPAAAPKPAADPFADAKAGLAAGHATAQRLKSEGAAKPKSSPATPAAAAPAAPHQIKWTPAEKAELAKPIKATPKNELHVGYSVGDNKTQQDYLSGWDKNNPSTPPQPAQGMPGGRGPLQRERPKQKAVAISSSPTTAPKPA